MNFLIYILKVNIALVVLYALYRLVFQADTFFAWKRAVLLFSVAFALLYPLTDFYQLFSANVNVWSDSDLYAVSLDSITLTPTAVAEKTFTFGKIVPLALMFVYFAGAAFFLFRILMQIFSILQIWRTTRKTEISSATVLVAENVETPFSFFGKIVIGTNDYSAAELREILLHEQTHVRQHHSFDVILSELLCAFAWFNPAAWALKREIRLNLEYLADSVVLLSGCDGAHYQLNLVQLSYKNNVNSITNNFNFSPLKKRIIMMKKNQTSRKGVLKYALLVPATALLIGVNVSLNAQQQDGSFGFEMPKPKSNEQLADSIKIAEKVDVPPEFQGGAEAFYKFLADNLQYPPNTYGDGLLVVFAVQFTVDVEGNVQNLKHVGDWKADGYFDEVKRVFALMPKWKPAQLNGKSVATNVTLPIQFDLHDSTPLVWYIDGKQASEEEAVALHRNKTPIVYSNLERNQTVNGKKVHIWTITTESNEEIFTKAEQNPEFPGGIQALYKFISNNLRYPASAQQKGIQGKSVIRFIVKKDGAVSNVELLKGFDADCDAEAIRVIKSLPQFHPATQDKKPVEMYYTIPITFALQKQENINNETLTAIPNTVLWIIDGKEMPKNFDIKTIKSEDIEKMEVLKDKSATDIYGEKGKNGVILITTKKKGVSYMIYN
ncbi:cell envelope biogenesis protein TonB [Bacteroidia bacterium]|nr:cell envelope biogenesis protein TonB [Bacteroidia bacterium]